MILTIAQAAIAAVQMIFTFVLGMSAAVPSASAPAKGAIPAVSELRETEIDKLIGLEKIMSTQTLGEEPIAEELSTSFTGHDYEIPNEPSPHFYAHTLSDTRAGAYLGVGGVIRTLLTASMGEYRRIILVDVSADMVAHNRAHLALIDSISKMALTRQQQRHLYVLLLNGKVLAKPQLEKNFETGETKEASDKDAFLKAINEAPSIASLPGVSPQAFQELMAAYYIPAVPATYLEHLVAACKNLGLFKRGSYFSGLLPKPWAGTTNTLETPKTRKERGFETLYYWEDDLRWETVARLINEKRVLVVQANLAGRQGLKSLGRALSATRELVDTIDISNVMHYLKRHEESYRLLSNLLSLPTHSGTKVLFTVESCGRRNDDLITFTSSRFPAVPSTFRMDFRWAYFAASIPDFVRLFQRPDSKVPFTASEIDGLASYCFENRTVFGSPVIGTQDKTLASDSRFHPRGAL